MQLIAQNGQTSANPENVDGFKPSRGGERRPTDGALEDKALLFEPNIRLYGPINDASVQDFLGQLREVRKSDAPVIMELTTEGERATGNCSITAREALDLGFIVGVI